MEKVIDISKFQTVTDWNKVKGDVDAVIIRLGYRGYHQGNIVYDPKYKEFQSACAAYNIPYSVYFFPCSITDQEAVEEADFIIKAVDGLRLTLPVFLDSEVAEAAGNGRADKLSRDNRTRFLKIICERLEAAGIRSGVYASTYWLNNNLKMSELSAFTTWVAQYNTKCTYKGTYSLWQYTSKGSIAGITGNVDVSRVTGALPTMDGSPVIIEPTPEPVKAVPYTVGKNYVTQCNLYVRDSANGNKKNFNSLTANGKKHGYADSSGKAILRKGTTVTCQDVKQLPSGQVWIKIPSGWICGIYTDGSIYVK